MIHHLAIGAVLLLALLGCSSDQTVQPSLSETETSATTTIVSDESGGPVAYSFIGPIKKLPNEGRPRRKVAFPTIANRNSLRIVLERTACFGTCPGYRVEIRADGSVRYEGEWFVAISGRHQARVPVEAVRALYEAFVRADFFWTLDEYRAEISDLPTHTVSISFDGRTKKVIDYGGQAIGMPKEIGELENIIDATAETRKWVKGDENTFASLEAEHWDFHSQRDNNLSLIESSATSGNLDLLNKLLKAGVRADTTFGCFGLQSAAYAGNSGVAIALVDAKAPVHWEPPKGKEDESCDALSMAAMSGVTAIVHAILEQHPDVNWSNFFGRTPLMLAAEAYSDNKRPERDFAATVRMLIAAGADVNLRDEDGESAIMKVGNNADVVRILLAAGAKDINKPLRGGNTVIMRTYDPEVTRALLEGGADPWFVHRGENAFEYVSRTYGRDNLSAAVLKQWMSTHPKPN